MSNIIDNEDVDVTNIRCPDCKTNQVLLNSYHEGIEGTKYISKASFFCVNVKCNRANFGLDVKVTKEKRMVEQKILVFNEKVENNNG